MDVTTLAKVPSSQDHGVDGAKQRFLGAVGGPAKLTLSTETVRAHAMDADSFDINRCRPTYIGVGDDHRVISLIATEHIRKGQVITMVQPAFLIYDTKPDVIHRLGKDSVSQLAPTSDAYVDAKKSSLFNTYSAGHGVSVVTAQLTLGLVGEEGSSECDLEQCNRSYLGAWANECGAMAAIHAAVDGFIRRHAVGVTDDARDDLDPSHGTSRVVATEEQLFDLCAMYTYLAASQGVNAVLGSLDGSCIQCVLALKDISKGEHIALSVGVGRWLGTCMSKLGFSFSAIAEVLGNMQNLQQDERFMERIAIAAQRHADTARAQSGV